MDPANVRISIGAVLLLATLVGMHTVPKEYRVLVTPFGVLGFCLLVLALLP